MDVAIPMSGFIHFKKSDFSAYLYEKFLHLQML